MTADLIPPWHPPTIWCLGCSSPHTTMVTAGSARNLFCLSCGSCWHPAAYGGARVAVHECPGCAYQAVCLAAEPVR